MGLPVPGSQNKGSEGSKGNSVCRRNGQGRLRVFPSFKGSTIRVTRDESTKREKPEDHKLFPKYPRKASVDSDSIPVAFGTRMTCRLATPDPSCVGSGGHFKGEDEAEGKECRDGERQHQQELASQR